MKNDIFTSFFIVSMATVNRCLEHSLGSYGILPLLCECYKHKVRNLKISRKFEAKIADAQADLSLRWAHSHIVGFVTRWLIFAFL